MWVGFATLHVQPGHLWGFHATAGPTALLEQPLMDGRSSVHSKEMLVDKLQASHNDQPSTSSLTGCPLPLWSG